MPFRDKEWEDFQRDCDFFPAYTDYIFGVDTRVQVAQEPGLHPQIYSHSAPNGYAIVAATLPRAQNYNMSTPDTSDSQGTLHLPSPPVFLSNGVVGQRAGTNKSTVPAPNSWNATSNGSPFRSTVRQPLPHSPLGSTSMIAPPPTWNTQRSREQPGAHLAPTSSPVTQFGLTPNTTAPRFLQPNELLNETLFGFMNPDLRQDVNGVVILDWHTINTSVSTTDKTSAVRNLSTMSQMVFNRQQEWFITKRNEQQQQQQQHNHHHR